MGKVYIPPPDTGEEEKPIGGILTLKQFFWLLGGFIIGVFVYLILYYITRVQAVALVPAIILGLSGTPFAFYKKHQMDFFTYLRRKKVFNKKEKKLINQKGTFL